MEKRDLILDFTSLLDIIMIILFVVIGGMGQTSVDAKAEAQEKTEENAKLQQELRDSQKALADLQEENEKMLAKNDSLQKEQKELILENNLYRAKEKEAEINEAQLYEGLMRKCKKITLICTPYMNANKTESNEVEITLYSGASGGEQEALEIVIFTHNFHLTREERAAKNAEMRMDMYRAFENIIKEDPIELALFTIEYVYGDINFSQADLDNIMGAIEDIERNYSISCYIDKVKR